VLELEYRYSSNFILLEYSLISISGFKFPFPVGSGIFVYFGERGVSAVQGHPRSPILVPIESAYATSYWSVIVTLDLSCTVSEIWQLLCAPDPTPIQP